MAEPVEEMAEPQEPGAQEPGAQEPKEAEKEPEQEKPKKAAKVQPELPKEAPEEITLQTPDGPITFQKKRPVGRPKKEAQAKSGKEPNAKVWPKKVVVEAPEETQEQPPVAPEKENEPPPEPPPLARMSGREKFEEHGRYMSQLRCDAKESQRVKYRAMLRA